MKKKIKNYVKIGGQFKKERKIIKKFKSIEPVPMLG